MESRSFTILVGTDFHRSSRRAMAEATTVAKKVAGSIEVVHVVPSSVAAPIELMETGPEGLTAAAAERLEDLLAYSLGSGVPVRAHLRLGHPVDGLLEAIAELAPDLVVLGSEHGELDFEWGDG